MTEQELTGFFMRRLDDERPVPQLNERQAGEFSAACQDYGFRVVGSALINTEALRTLRIDCSVRGLARAVFDLGDLIKLDVYAGPYVEIDQASGEPVQRQGLRLFQKRLKLVQDETRTHSFFKSERLA